jgi:hypothetical protein
MSEPWGIPPFPQHGDPSPEITWAAVGRALSDWEERVELHFARLYARILSIPPAEAIFRPAYKDAPNFSDRASIIERAAEHDSILRPDQDQESMFKNAMSLARNLAKRRNDIAHGVVRFHWQIDKSSLEAVEINEYMLTPATYRAKMFDAATRPAYLFSSIEINYFAEQFRFLGEGHLHVLLSLWE